MTRDIDGAGVPKGRTGAGAPPERGTADRGMPRPTAEDRDPPKRGTEDHVKPSGDTDARGTPRPKEKSALNRAASNGFARVVLALLWLLHWLPLPVVALLGRGLGRLLYRVASSRRKVGRRNLELCMPELTAAAREALLREHFGWLGQSLLERGLLWWASPARLKRLIQVEGDIGLAERSDKPVMWLVPHFIGLDVAGASMESGAGLIQYDCHGGANQKFRVAEASDRRYVQIIAQHSNMCMDVAGASMDNSVQLIQYPCHGGDNQQFRLDRRGDYYQVVAKHSGKCLDISGASRDNGARLIQYDCHGGTNQQFRF